MKQTRFFLLQAVGFVQNFAKIFAKITACFCLLMSVSSCEKSNEPQILEPSEKSETLLNRVFFAKELQLDPQQVKDLAESSLVRDLFVGLMAFDSQGNIVSGVSRHSFSEDGKKWLFVLDENARWSNGEVVTADDFVASWQRLFDRTHPSPWASYLAEIKIENAQLILDNEVPLFELGVRALSANTLEIELEKPNFQLPTMLAHVALLPSYQGKKPDRNLVSNGAYRLESLESQRAILQAEDEASYFQKVIYQLAAENHILQGFDLVENPKLEDPNMIRLPRLCTYFYEFNFNDPLVGQKNVRQAVRSMLNVTELSEGLGIPLHSAIPQTMRQNLDRLPFGGNTESILALMGIDYGNVLNFTLTLSKNEAQALIANRFIRQLSQSDLFRIRLLEVDSFALEALREQQNFQIIPRNLCVAYDDPRAFLRIFHSQSQDNKSGYGNENIDRWLEELDSDNLNHDQWHDRISKIVQKISDDVAILPLFQYQRTISAALELRGIDYRNDSGVVYSKDLSRKSKKDIQ